VPIFQEVLLEQDMVGQLLTEVYNNNNNNNNNNI
jgi:hypothetical protein